jgi:hypothetical protein
MFIYSTFSIDDKMVLPTMADKKTYYFIEGLKSLKNVIVFDPNTKEPRLSKEALDIFHGYALDEENRIRHAKEQFKAATGVEYNDYIDTPDNYTIDNNSKE